MKWIISFFASVYTPPLAPNPRLFTPKVPTWLLILYIFLCVYIYIILHICRLWYMWIWAKINVYTYTQTHTHICLYMCVGMHTLCTHAVLPIASHQPLACWECWDILLNLSPMAWFKGIPLVILISRSSLFPELTYCILLSFSASLSSR